MTTATATVEVRKVPRGYAIYADASILNRSFKTREKAERWAEDNAEFLARWAGRISA